MTLIQQATAKLLAGTLAIVCLSVAVFDYTDVLIMDHQDSQLFDVTNSLADTLARQSQDEWDATIEASANAHSVFFHLAPIGDYSDLTKPDPSGSFPDEAIPDETAPSVMITPPSSTFDHPFPGNAFINSGFAFHDSGILTAVPILGSNWELVAEPMDYPIWPATLITGVLLLGLYAALIITTLRPLKIQSEKLIEAARKANIQTTENQIPDRLSAELQRLHQEHAAGHEQWRDLLHGVAHEIRSPLARISFAISEWKLLQTPHTPYADSVNPSENTAADEQRELENIMERATQDLDQLAHEVLRYSRLELMSNEQLSRSSIMLEEMVDACYQRLAPVYTNVQFDSHGETPFSVHADTNQLERAILNLLRNAARYSQGHVTVSWISNKTDWQLIIEDDGPGIPPGKRARVFEPFTRLDPSRSRDSGGNGLGLAIVKAIMDNHNGTVTVDDSDHGGARFVLTFPTQLKTADDFNG
ncbi:Sensor protein RstB [BD1-7 clade bacterium]|uniref:histidine kinase n=1 Tax=BD1-7 clade bacterium TaxID=2029982 RepID=A0A5S9PLP6_9GAMM|nr:Sensor protein RstB [BD1-7 clade bacterium]